MSTERLMNKKMERRRLKYQMLYIASYALLTVFASCDRNEQLPAESILPGEQVALEVTGIGLDNAVANRALTASAVPTDSKIGFYLKGDQGYTHVYNREGAYNTTKSKWVPSTVIYLGSNTATLAIYYPYDKDQSTSSGKLKLTSILRENSDHTSRTDMDIWSDRFTANLLSCFGTNKIERNLTHVYTRMFITLKKDDTFIGDGKWTGVKLEGGGVYTNASFDPLEATKKNAYSDYSTLGFACTFDEKTVSTATNPTTDLLLVPTGDMSTDLKITVTVSGKAMEVTIPKTMFTEYETGKYRLVPEKQYNLTIILRPTDLEVSSLKTIDWEPVDLSGKFETTN